MDLEGNGFYLTDAQNGVLFDVIPNGTPERVAWTAAGSDDGWLALDRNGNGVIDDGMELFGNYTSQRASENLNGFVALAVFDEIGFGGNGDSLIDQRDDVYADLQVWRDLDHDGISDADELSKLADSGIEAIELRYERSRLVDEHGNEFRYRTAIHAAPGSPAGPDAYDVFLVTAPSGFDDPGADAGCSPSPVCLFTSTGDFVHISSTPPKAASGHGWWINIDCASSLADVTVQLQVFFQGTWFDVGNAGSARVRSGGGSGARATGRVTCHGNGTFQWRSVVDVDVVNRPDDSRQFVSPARSLSCSPFSSANHEAPLDW